MTPAKRMRKHKPVHKLISAALLLVFTTHLISPPFVFAQTLPAALPAPVYFLPNADLVSTLTTQSFVYDGWNPVIEMTDNGSLVTSKYFIWGLDLSGSLQGAGGIGGLLAGVEGTVKHLFFYDGNGNVGQLVNVAGGALDARYEYDPYGNTIVATGPLASTNPFRFSTKYLDAESGLYYYGYRYYDPQTGRWLNSDPIEEDGGLHLYTFVLNDPINQFDALGQQTSTIDRPLMYSDFERAIQANPSTSKSLFQKAYRGISQKLGIVIYALLRIQELTTEEQCLKVVIDDFKKTYKLENEEVQALATLILAASQGKDNIVRQFKNERKLPIYWVLEAVWPNIYEHTNAYIMSHFGGRLQILNYNGQASEQTDRNRAAIKALQPFTPGRSSINNSFDEYPMASTVQGGNIHDISVRWVPRSENNSQGGTLETTVYRRHQLKKFDPFLAITVPRSGIR